MYSKQIPVGVRKACLVMKILTFWSRRQELEDVPHCPCCFSKDWSKVRAEQLILSQILCSITSSETTVAVILQQCFGVH